MMPFQQGWHPCHPGRSGGLGWSRGGCNAQDHLLVGGDQGLAWHCHKEFWLSMFGLAISGNGIDYYMKDEFIISSLMTHIFGIWHQIEIELYWGLNNTLNVLPQMRNQRHQTRSTVFTVWNYWTQLYCGLHQAIFLVTCIHLDSEASFLSDFVR